MWYFYTMANFFAKSCGIIYYMCICFQEIMTKTESMLVHTRDFSVYDFEK